MAFLAAILFLYGCASEINTSCPKDAMLCPDGSAVGRQGPSCVFPPCRDGKEAGNTGGAAEGTGNLPAKTPVTAEKIIPTRLGDLTLKYENSKATLSGIFSRSTPCVDWQVEVKESEALVEFNVFNRNKDEICIQVLGKPQGINAVSDAAPDAAYKITLESEPVFTGKISGQSNGNSSKKICEAGKEYKHNAVTPLDCACPDGYEFETVSMGWGPCPAGLRDCSASVLKCVKKS